MSEAPSETIAPVPTNAAEEKGKAPTNPAELQANADRLVAEGQKAVALKQWEEGVNKYGDALEVLRELVDEFDPKMAPVLLAYGKALYELAFSQQGVMGKEEVDKTAEAKTKSKGPKEEEEDEDVPAGNNFSFAEPAFEGEGEGDEGEGAEEEGEGEEEEGEGAEEGGDGEGGDEPEDDYNAAWEVLDVARTIYTKILDEAGLEGQGMREERLRLADTYLALGDVSCETENFPQAVADYTSALGLQTKLLAPSSRTLASTHYQLATALEFLPNKRSEALSHVQASLSGFKSLLSELKGDTPTENDSVKKMSAKDKEGEMKDVEALIGDLEVKIEELKAAPEVGDLVSQSIDHLLGNGDGEASGSGGIKADTTPVNDLTSMVRKKPAKKVQPQPVAAAATGNGSTEAKRKAEEEAAGGADKKTKAE